jgi:hypothetical protein
VSEERVRQSHAQSAAAIALTGGKHRVRRAQSSQSLCRRVSTAQMAHAGSKRRGATSCGKDSRRHRLRGPSTALNGMRNKETP